MIFVKKGNRKDIKNYRPICLLSNTYKLFTKIITTRLEKKLDENQPREHARCRSKYSTTDHIHTKKCHEYNTPLWVAFMDFEKEFDSVQTQATLTSLQEQGRRCVDRNPERHIRTADDADTTYSAYCNMLICAAKKSIPRGFNKHYIPGWDNSCNHLLREHQQVMTQEDIDTTATALLQKLDEVRRARWTEVVESVDFTHSSRKTCRS